MPASQEADTPRHPNLPGLVSLLLEAGKREEALIENLAAAVATGDKDTVFAAAEKLVGGRMRLPPDEPTPYIDKPRQAKGHPKQ